MIATPELQAMSRYILQIVDVWLDAICTPLVRIGARFKLPIVGKPVSSVGADIASGITQGFGDGGVDLISWRLQ
ncbi:MAG: hypothetical protein NWR12_07445 [Haliea sp.]|nr:hypothetical protein [Haliea sp.]MDP4917536.1 hypothetical protein [Haliea sp.]